jgi:hypothetical protein
MATDNTVFRLTPALIAAAMLLVANGSYAKEKLGFELDDALVPAKYIVRGTRKRDAIPAIDNPEYLPVAAVGFLDDDDRIIGVSRNGIQRAYPVAMLNYHEIVNDVIDAEAVAITYCPLCGSGMAFIATIKGQKYQFGVSGLLYNSDVLLYDRETESLWSQLMSTAITGPMKGNKLTSIPVTHTTWRDWLARYPETEVLSPNTGHRVNYRVDPYPNYGSSGKLYFPVSKTSKLYRRKEIVLGLEINETFKAYPFEELENGPGHFSDSFEGQSFDVMFDAENETARILDADGKELPTTMAFWFAWYAFHPDTEVYTAKPSAK